MSLWQRPSRQWALLASGRGSNAQVWLDHLEGLNLRWVASDQKEAPVLRRAQMRGVPFSWLGRPMNWSLLFQELQRRKINSIILLGFMKIIPKDFLNQWKGLVLNLHPSLLPHYPGLKAIERAVADHAELGVTVHHVVPEVDAGKFLLQKKDFLSTSQQREKWNLENVYQRVTLMEQQLMREVIIRWN